MMGMQLVGVNCHWKTSRLEAHKCLFGNKITSWILRPEHRDSPAWDSFCFLNFGIEVDTSSPAGLATHE